MRCKGAVLIAGAVGIVSAAAYVYANRKCYQAKLETTRKERGKTGKTGSSYDDPDDYFQDAVAQVSNHGDQLPNTAKLEFYALFKQANFGPCTTPRPSLIDQVARAKWDAWSSLGNLPRDDAQVSYVALVCECFPRFLCDSASESASEGRGTRKKSGGGDGGGGELGFGPVFSVMMQDDSDDTPGLPADGIHNLAKLGHLQPMKAWLRAGGDINLKDVDERSALHWATDSGHEHVVDWLLENGARVDDQDFEGCTALFCAAMCEREELCRKLLQAGADPTVADSSGETPHDLFLKEWNLGL